jgi:DNA (cytosine-5)-methyltransferase 1
MKNKNVIDLFAGVGGLSLGAARGGFQVKAAVELDDRARTTHAQNFPSSIHLANDIATLTGKELLRQSSLPNGQLHGLVGGPPCQGFSTMGLRDGDDPRNALLGHFCRLVAETRPAFFLMENVPGLLNSKNAGLLSNALAKLPHSYVVLPPMTVKASDYGAPTTRTRVFFYGYDANRIAALTTPDFVPHSADDVRVRRALAGLPSLRSTWQTEPQSWRTVRPVGDQYFERRLSGVVPAGVGNQEALNLYRSKKLVSGFLGTLHGDETINRFRRLRPGKSDAISKCMKLDGDGYCPTLRAGTGPERGSYQAIRPVHPNSPRVICPREAARLQGFPDWFQFHPTKWHAFRQIGNSVSPLVSELLMLRIHRALT